MYCSFFGFREKPFNIVPNPAFLYPSAKHRMALTYLEYGLSEGTGFILLTGEIGIGKTTLLRHILKKLDTRIEAAVLFNTNVGADDLIKQVLREFEIEPEGGDKSANLDKLNTFLIERYAAGKRPLLIIDEAQNLGLAALEEVRMLSNLQTDRDNLLQIMLVGQPELKQRIRDPRLAQLAQRITVSYHLAPLNREETGEYVAHRLKSAGGSDDGLFPPEAVDLIYEKSKGIPRSINILCDAALVYAFADELKVVTELVVQQVLRDREQEGVVPEGAVWVATATDTEPHPATAATGAVDGATLQRLAALEAKIAELNGLVSWQGQELQSRLDDGRDRIVSKLHDLLEQERKNCDKLLVHCTHYKRRAQELERKLDISKEHRSKTESSAPRDTPAKSSGFFRKVFG